MQNINELLSIERPSRYRGGEWNIAVKKHPVECRLLLAFPNTYEIGMSHLGMKILYSLINNNESLAAERAYAPWPDMEARLRASGEPLSSLETGLPAREFDLIGFSLQSELDFTNVLSMLDLAGIPLAAAERDVDLPLVIAGGPVAFNPEPLAAFIDLFLIGDAEEQLPALMLDLAELKGKTFDKTTILRELSKLEGIYAPALYRTEIDKDSGFEVVANPDSKAAFIRKAMIADLDNFPFPSDILVPYCDIVHDRAAVELSRGCSRGCRFCQAGVIYMPERQRSPQSVADSIAGMLSSTGYSDVSLSALTPNDYEGLRPLVAALMRRFREESVSLSFASLSPSRVDADLLEMVKEVRKTGLTIAPEAGTQRMRDVINKGIREEDVLSTAATAFDLGWKLVKLYFMIGLPTETDDDVEEIARLARKVAGLRTGVKVKIGCSNFVPKCHTPFQWVAMNSRDELLRKQGIVLKALRNSRVDFSSHDVDESLLEGVLSRGDRRVGAAVERAWRLGCRFDGWSDMLRVDLWHRAFAEAGIEPEFYNGRLIPPFARLPWSHIDTRVPVEFLQEEYQRSLGAETLVRCMPKNCPRCRACPPGMLKERWGEQRDGDYEIDMPPSPLVFEGSIERWRFRFSKGGELLSLGHLDLARLVARIFRRAGIAVAMSQGFHPQPRIAFALALPLGQEGCNEYFDAALVEPPAAEKLLTALNDTSPEGIVFSAAECLLENGKSLSAELAAADYRVRRIDRGKFDRHSIEQFLALDELEWKRLHKGKTKLFDLRNRVLMLENSNSWGELRLRIRLGEGISAKPSEVIEAVFGLNSDRIEVIREQLYVERDGRLRPPM